MVLTPESRLADLPILDPHSLRDLLDLGADLSLVQELIDLFCEDVPPRLETLHRCLAAGDVAQILLESHQLKGALGNLGLMRFADLTGRVETEARAGRFPAAQVLVDALPAAYDEALGALREAFPQP